MYTWQVERRARDKKGHVRGREEVKDMSFCILFILSCLNIFLHCVDMKPNDLRIILYIFLEFFFSLLKN